MHIKTLLQDKIDISHDIDVNSNVISHMSFMILFNCNFQILGKQTHVTIGMT